MHGDEVFKPIGYMQLIEEQLSLIELLRLRWQAKNRIAYGLVH
jgi:hypothetical protein